MERATESATGGESPLRAVTRSGKPGLRSCLACGLRALGCAAACRLSVARLATYRPRRPCDWSCWADVASVAGTACSLVRVSRPIRSLRRAGFLSDAALSTTTPSLALGMGTHSGLLCGNPQLSVAHVCVCARACVTRSVSVSVSVSVCAGTQSCLDGRPQPSAVAPAACEIAGDCKHTQRHTYTHRDTQRHTAAPGQQ